MLEAMPSRLLDEWMAYFGLEPFGDELLDTHLATITAILFNANRPRGEKTRQVKDFQQWRRSSAKPFDAQRFFDNLKSWAMLSGAKKKDDVE